MFYVQCNPVFVPEEKEEIKRGMGLILYSKEDDGSFVKLQGLGESMLPKDEIEIFHSIESLKERLLQPINAVTIAVVIAGNSDELLNLLSLSDLLHLKVQLILVLPDSKPETIHIGWKFHPRLLSYNNGDFHEVHAVMAKMFENLNLPKGEEKGR